MKINPVELARKIEKAKMKKAEAETELSGFSKTVEENQNILEHEAHMDYLGKLNQDLQKAFDTGNQKEAESVMKDIFAHKASLAEIIKARTDIGEYVSSGGEANLEKLQQKMDAFMQETLTIWYGKEDAKKAKLFMTMKPLSEMDYDSILKDDPAKFGEYSMNPETAGMNHLEKEPKVKILNEELKQFIGKPRAEVINYVVENYGQDYHIPGMEYEEYLLSLPKDKIPAQFKDDNWYYFMGSTLRRRGGDSGVPAVGWDGAKLGRGARWLRHDWDGGDRVVLLEK